MCGQGAQSRLCLPGFALEAVRGAVRGAVARRPGGRPDEVDAASQLLRRAVCQGDVAGCCLTPGIYCSTMIHEPLLRLLGEDASAPNIGLPVAGPGLCDPCREPWRGIGAARACARARRSTELRGAELRLEAAPAPGCRAEIGAGGQAEAGDGDDQAGRAAAEAVTAAAAAGHQRLDGGGGWLIGTGGGPGASAEGRVEAGDGDDQPAVTAAAGRQRL